MPKERILLIEDDESVRIPLGELLSANGYEVTLASGGREGLDVVEDGTPDLILCDIMMPDLDGKVVRETLLRDEETANIPFIFLTAKTSEKDIREGMALGADDYITKPYEPETLLKAIAARIRRFRSLHMASTRRANDHVFLKDGDRCWIIEFKDLHMVESLDTRVRLHFRDGETCVMHRTMGEMEAALPAKLFVRANRQQIVNLNWIKALETWFSGSLMMHTVDGLKIEMSRRASQAFRDRFSI